MTADQSVTRAKRLKAKPRPLESDPMVSVVDYDREEVRSIERHGLYEPVDPPAPYEYLP